MTAKLRTIALGLVIIAIATTLVTVGLKFTSGAFRSYYYVNAILPRAGQQLELEADVRIRGVKVGEVSNIQLRGRKAVVTLRIDEPYKVPRDARAFIGIKTLLGERFVGLSFPPHDHGPYLADGSTITRTVVGPEIEAVLADGTRVLNAIKPQDAATIVTTLADAMRNQGLSLRRSLIDNARLSRTFASTTRDQIAALDDLDTVFGALKAKGVDLNRLARAINQGVPVYASNRAAANMRRALVALVPFSNDLADLLIVDREQWDRMIDRGDVVLGTLARHPQGIRDLIHGLYRYVYKLGGAIDRNLLPDGSAQAGFVNFIGGDSFKEQLRQICYALPQQVRHNVSACGGGGR